MTVDKRSAAVIDALEAVDPEFVMHLPSSTLKAVLDHFITGSGAAGRRVFPVPREEDGVSIATGLRMAGRRVVLIIQDNGIGNLLTALLTFPQPYHVPLFVLVTRRGGPGEYNSMIHTISERSEAILDAGDVRWVQLDGRTPVEDWSEAIRRAHVFSETTHRPVFVLANLMGG